MTMLETRISTERSRPDPRRFSGASSPAIQIDVSAERPAAPDDLASIADFEPIAIGSDLVIFDGAGSEVDRITVRFANRVSSDDLTVLNGTDESKAIRVRLRLRSSRRHLKVTVKYKPLSVSSPAELLPALRFLARATPDRKVGLWFGDGEVWASPPMPLPVSEPVSASYLGLVEALAAIQEVAGSFAMPAHVTDAEAAEVQKTVDLIGGNRVHGTWNAMTVGFDEPESAAEYDDALISGGRLEFTAPWVLDLGGESVVLHDVRYTLDAAQLDGSDQARGDGTAVHLVPGPVATFTAHLPRPDTGSSSGRQRQPPGVELRALAGRWIAQSGPTIVASGETRDEVRAAVAAVRPVPVVWRVPAEGEPTLMR